MAIPNYIIPIKKGEKKGKKTVLYAINIHIISYLLTKKKKKKEREKSFLFCLYDFAINIQVFMLGN